MNGNYVNICLSTWWQLFSSMFTFVCLLSFLTSFLYKITQIHQEPQTKYWHILPTLPRITFLKFFPFLCQAGNDFPFLFSFLAFQSTSLRNVTFYRIFLWRWKSNKQAMAKGSKIIAGGRMLPLQVPKSLLQTIGTSIGTAVFTNFALCGFLGYFSSW